MKLEKVDANWTKSHELFWGYRQDEPVETYLEQAIAPLLDAGRIPVLITNLDPAKDNDEIEKIFRSKPKGVNEETILVRLAFNSEKSIYPIAKLIKKLIKDSQKTKEMPRWWPLIQAEFDLRTWRKLKKTLGKAWKYSNIAMTPFMNEKIVKELKDQITVAQFFLGKANGIKQNGDIRLDLYTCTGLRGNIRKYNIFSYAKKIKITDSDPTCIICSPSDPRWSVQKNQRRLKKMIDG